MKANIIQFNLKRFYDEFFVQDFRFMKNNGHQQL